MGIEFVISARHIDDTNDEFPENNATRVLVELRAKDVIRVHDLIAAVKFSR